MPSFSLRPSVLASYSAKQAASAAPASSTARVSSQAGQNAPLAATPAGPDYWLEKGIFWHLPDLAPVGAADYGSIIPMEAALGFTPADRSLYGDLPVSPLDLPIFVGTGAIVINGQASKPGTVPYYRVWTTVGTLPLVVTLLQKLDFAINGVPLSGSQGITSTVGPAIPAGELRMRYIGVKTQQGITTAPPPRYAYVNPAGALPPGVATGEMCFTQIYSQYFS